MAGGVRNKNDVGYSLLRWRTFYLRRLFVVTVPCDKSRIKAAVSVTS